MEKHQARIVFAAILLFSLIFPLHLVEATSSITVTPKTLNMGTVGLNNFEDKYIEKTRANIIIATDTGDPGK